MQSRRDYLVSLGLAKPGRGKFSTVAKEALVKAEQSGMKFSDAPTTQSTPVVKSDAPVKTDATMTQYLTPSEYRFPEAEYKGITFVDGKRKEVSLRECCNLCRVSLVNHGCDNPTIHGNITVKIERR